MEEEVKENHSAAEAEEELEFRPWVLWTGVGLAASVCIGLCILAYSYSYNKGYQQGERTGFERAIQSGMVQERLNTAASQNVLSFMRLASASDEHLLRVAGDVEAAFGWIKDAGVRAEAEWCLADALLQRRLTTPAISVLTSLFEAVPRTTDWACRALHAGNLLMAQQQYAAAGSCYQLALSVFEEKHEGEYRLLALRQMVALEMCTPRSLEEAMTSCGKLLDDLKEKGAEPRPLCDMLQVHMGELQRCAGQPAAAEALFRAALDGVDTAAVTQPEYAVCYGTALLELGNAAAAEPLLRVAERNTGSRPSEMTARLQALRQLAVIEQGRSHLVTALSLLHRAQGVAEGRVHPGNAFWPCLFDQRGWMHYMVQNYQTALLDFSSALTATQIPALLVQPLEGAARCHLELGQTGQALPLLDKCLKIRKELFAADRAAMGRIHLLLGQIYDQQGKTAEAEAGYAAAVAHLEGDGIDEVDNRRLALMGQAYALTQLQRWQDAYHAWEQLLPLLGDQHDRREEARHQMRRLKPHLTPAPQPQAPQEAQQEPLPAESLQQN